MLVDIAGHAPDHTYEGASYRGVREQARLPAGVLHDDV